MGKAKALATIMVLLGFGLLCAAPAGAVTRPPPPPPPPPPSVAPTLWHMVLDSEFNGTSLDSPWTPQWFGGPGPVNHKETSCYSPNNVSEGNGVLSLSVSAGSTCGKPDTGAIVTTYPGFLYTYGYAEASIYTPADSSGLIANLAGFWGDGTNWPRTGENDIFESLGGVPCWTFHDLAGTAGHGCTTTGPGWHVYAAEWTPSSMIYFYDGVEVGQISSRGVTSAPMYLVLEFSSAPYGGSVVTPATMQVDYVHVWQANTG